jgi:hypothetical protein
MELQIVGIYTVPPAVKGCTICSSGTGRGKKYFCLLQNVQTDSLSHPDICSVAKGDSAEGSKAGGARG